MWVLLLILVGGIAYVAMEPEMLTELLNPILGESVPLPGAPPRVMTPKPQPPATAAPVPAPAPESAPTGAPLAPSAPAMPPPSAAPAPPAPPAAAIPMFAEGQKVTVTLDPTAPGESVSLSMDSLGTTPGPLVKPGVTLTVLDGEIQGNNWVYSVRTDEGTKGWVPEKRLRLKF